MTDLNHADLRQGIVDTCQEMNRNGLNQGTSAISRTGFRMHADHADESALRSHAVRGHCAMDFARITRATIALHPNGAFIVIFCGAGRCECRAPTHSTFSTILAVHERGIPCFHYMVAVAVATISGVRPMRVSARRRYQIML